MKKQIYYYPNGNIVVVEGSPEIQLGKQLPSKTIEFDMDDEICNKWQSNPIEHKSKFERITKDALKLKNGKGMIKVGKEEIEIKRLTTVIELTTIKTKELAGTQEGETTT